MASTAAQAYFNSFSPEDQANIRASWGGADLMDQWFQNAVAAGGTPAAAAANETFAQKVRRISREQGWSEDFGRPEFTDAVLESWKPYWDEAKGRFRSEHTPPGHEGEDWTYVDKPSESVVDPATGHEWGPWGNQAGVDLTAKAAQTPAAVPAAEEAPAVVDPYAEDLQQGLIDLISGQGGIFAEGGNDKLLPGELGLNLSGGGVWWQPGTPTTTEPTPVPTFAPARLFSASRGAVSERNPLFVTNAKPFATFATPSPAAPDSSLTQALLTNGTAAPSTFSNGSDTSPTSPLQQGLLKKKYPFASVFNPTPQWWA